MLAREHGTAVVTAPLDSYVTSRMITLSAPSHALMDRDPLTVRPDDLVVDIADDRSRTSTTARRLPSTSAGGRSAS